MLLKYFWQTWWQKFITIFLAGLLLIFVIDQAYAAANRDRIYPGVRLGAYAVGGLTPIEAERTLAAALDTVRTHGLVFYWRDRAVVVPMVAAASDPDLSYAIISYDIPQTLAQAQNFGRDGSWFEIGAERVQALLGQAQLAPIFTWRQDKVVEVLRANLSMYEQGAADAALVWQNGSLSVTPERSGVVFNYQSALTEAEQQLSSLLLSPILLQMKSEEPAVTAAEVTKILAPAQSWLTTPGDIVLSHQDRSWVWPRLQLIDLLELRRDNRAADGIRLGLAPPRLRRLLEPIITEFSRPAQEPKFRREDSKVVEFQPGRVGQAIDFLATWEAWERALFTDRKTAVTLAVAATQPRQTISDLNNLGIRELLGVGQSNFKGSPRNRRHNIAVGAEAVNGTLIAPGEEFSLLKTLGKIDAKAGYLPELVIKGNRTVPEYGGGLCQIGTTTFRGTLAAGLPVTARQNHSYQVPYYANDKGLPGTDATIYEPAPDYRFKNDTANYVLITTAISGDDLFFEYWGAPDGRAAEQSEVRVWDRVPPAPVKLVETLDLPPGVKKCTERPHAGIKAAFDYKITYPDGRVDAQTFSSQYRPWQEVCLIGVEELTASSTAPVLAPEDASVGTIN